jgi:hypothetical protein
MLAALHAVANLLSRRFHSAGTSLAARLQRRGAVLMGLLRGFALLRELGHPPAGQADLAPLLAA